MIGRSFLASLAWFVTVATGAMMVSSWLMGRVDRIKDTQVIIVHLPSTGVFAGAEDAPVQLVEFGSMTCQYCEEFVVEGWGGLEDKFIVDGTVQYRYVDVSPTRAGRTLAATARCLARDLGVAEARGRVFETAANVPVSEVIKAVADELSLNAEKLGACVDSDKRALWTAQERAAAVEAGVSGTPTFLVGPNDGRDVVGWVVTGFNSDVLEEYIGAAETAVVRSARIGAMEGQGGGR